MHLFSVSQHACVVWLGAVSLWAHAQTPHHPPAPTTPNVATTEGAPPALVYASPLAGYRRYSETQIQDWNAANQTVHQVGGWRAYAQEAQPAAATPSSGTHRGH